MYIFKKTKKKVNKKKLLKKKIINIKNLKKEFFLFQKKCRDKISYLKKQHNEIVAFGAAQMMPILAYHSKTDFSFIDALFDDNPNRIGRYLPKIDWKIKKTNSKKSKILLF